MEKPSVDQKTVSDTLLKSFDNLVSAGDTMPIDELKKRYSASTYFKGYRASTVYEHIIDLPVTVDMIVDGGGIEAIRKVLSGLRELHGDALLYELGGYTNAQLTVQRWKSDDDLRKAWKEFAESEYKSANLAAVTEGAA